MLCEVIGCSIVSSEPRSVLVYALSFPLLSGRCPFVSEKQRKRQRDKEISSVHLHNITVPGREGEEEREGEWTGRREGGRVAGRERGRETWDKFIINVVLSG